MPRAAHVAAARRAIDVERDRLVLALLERVPQPQRPHRSGGSASRMRWFASSCSASIAVKCSSAQVTASCDVGDSTRRTVREEASQPGIDSRRGGRISVLDEQLVERAVLAPVHRLLTDEAGDGLDAELGIGDELAMLLHRVDEEPLAFGKQQRQRVQDRRVERDRPRTSRAGPWRRRARCRRRGAGFVHARIVGRGASRTRRSSAGRRVIIWGHVGDFDLPGVLACAISSSCASAGRSRPTRCSTALPITLAALDDPTTRVPLRVCEAIVARAHELTREPALAVHYRPARCGCRRTASSASPR